MDILTIKQLNMMNVPLLGILEENPNSMKLHETGFPERQGRAFEGFNLIPRLYGYVIPWADFPGFGPPLRCK